MYGILLVDEGCGTLDTAVNEAYFALFSMGAHLTGMTPYEISAEGGHFGPIFQSFRSHFLRHFGPF